MRRERESNEMANLRKWLEDAEVTYGEKIDAIVVGKHERASYSVPPMADENIVLSREDGLAKVDQEFDNIRNKHRVAECFPIYAWAKSRVFFVHEYDGEKGLSWVPRHPIQIEPEFSGQSD
jgi:hypothetical protein